jgi:hypothetical protein
MERQVSFRYHTEADRYWHDKIDHPGHCNSVGLLALAVLTVLCFL